MDLFKTERSDITRTDLKKNWIKNVIKYYYGKIDFPDCIYIALDNCIVCTKGSVVNMVDDMESPYDFIPLARIDQLVLNIPAREDFYRYFQEVHKVSSPEGITREMEDEFWSGYNPEFAPEACGIKIEWE